MESLSTLLGADTAHRITSLFDPNHVGRYPTRLGGMYTNPISSKETQQEVLSLLDIIYPKSPDRSDRIWRSIN